MLNSIRSNSISLFRISLLILISVYINNYLFYCLVVIYLIYKDNRFVFVYFLILHLILFINSLQINYIPIGIIDYKKGNYYVVDKLLYKSKISIDDDLSYGDIIITYSSENAYYDSDLKKNIKFIDNDYKVIANLYIRKLICNTIDNSHEDIKGYLNGFLYNTYTYSDTSQNIIYGLASYYFLKEIKKKNTKLCILMMFIISLLFTFQIKYILILIEIICDRYKFDKYLKSSFQILSILLINKVLFHDFGILFPILISIYKAIDLDISFINFMLIIQSFLFGEINMFNLLLFGILIKFRIGLYVLSVMSILFSYLSFIYNPIIKVFSFISSLNISIRGSPSIISIVFFLLLHKYLNKNIYKTVLIVILLLNPLNNPFSHISFIDIGQGDSIMIKNSLNKRCILIDTGSIYNYHKLKKFLFKQGIYKIDYLIISHDDSDHNGNIDNLKKDFYIKEIIEEGRDINYKNIFLKYFYLGEYDNDNDNSLVYGLDINEYRFLFTGDISKNVERVFIQKYGPYDVDVLKLSHHGSDTSSSAYFISNILPKYGIISTSGQYNHPKKSVIKTLKRYNVEYFNTKYDKTVSFYFTRYVKFIKTGNNEFVIIN